VSGIDWNSELRKIEREFDGLPPEPPKKPDAKPRLKIEPTVTRAPLGQRTTASAPATQPRTSEQTTALWIWARLALVGTLAVALAFWPYAHTCGFALFSYLGACGMVVIGGLWASTGTWRARMVRSHTFSLLLVLVGLMTIGAEIAPRVGYTRADATHPAHWWCAK